MIQIPCFQCSLCLETSIKLPQFKSVCLVAGIVNTSPLGRETLISLLRHLGIDRLKIDFPIEVFWLFDSELLDVLLDD